MNPMRFYLVFDVQGNAAQQLQSIGAQFSTLGTLAASSSQGVEMFHGSVIAMIHGLHQLSTVGQGAVEWGSSLLRTMYDLSHGVIEAAASFETMRARMGFAFNDQAEHIWSNIQEYAVNSVWRFGEVADVVGGLGIAIRGLSDEFHDLPRSYESRTGGMIDALQAIGDTAAGTGRSLSMVGFEVEQMMTGMFRGAHMVLRLTQQETETIKHAIAATSDAQQQFSAIMNVLASHYGGATEALGRTFQFLMLQIPDILEILQNELGKGSLRILSTGLQEAVNWLRSLVAPGNAAMIRSLSGGFETMAEGVVWATRALIHLGEKIRVFVAANPELVRFAVIAGTAAAALAVVGGTILSVTAGLGVLIASVQLAGMTIVTSLGMSVGLLATLTAGIVGLVTLGGALNDAYQNNLGGIATRFHQLSLVVQGLSQAFQNWSGEYTAITTDLANQMQNEGILGFFVNLVSWIARAREWWSGFVLGIQAGMAGINWSHIYEGIRSIERALLSVGISLHLLDPAAQTSFETMQERGRGFAELLNQVIVPSINLLAIGFRGAAWALETLVLPAISSLHTMGMTVLTNWEGIKTLIGLAGIAMFPILGSIAAVLTITNSWGTALDVVKTAFGAILTVAETLAEVVAYIGRGLSAIPTAFLNLVGASHLVQQDSSHPGESSSLPQTPMYMGATIPAAYEGSGRVEVTMPNGGNMAEAIREALRGMPNNQTTTQRSEPGGVAGTAPPPVVHNVIAIDGMDVASAARRANEDSSSRSGEISSRNRLWSGP